MSTSAARRRLLRSIIAEQPVHSQAELVELLASRGHPVTQATVSRDLQVIGAVKSDGDRYLVSERPDPGEALASLARAVDEFVESVASSGNLVVLTTPPGAAHVVAAAIDAARLDGVLGTVAGDDTVLAVASEEATGRGIVRLLEEIGASA